ncbi:hypothetical protein AG1IA_05993 [Rhizoctonia solani AG-1 IA]|uniref:Uncharacterized protein n=1 Tax=Thanatephorus cucumeris (strain AG1-IA) TaxID=983506 RepID=L8WT47_THACA|nr:hypothetical protein AG1IA_05993 [Rhizoctonia solani AG-1 IA]
MMQRLSSRSRCVDFKSEKSLIGVEVLDVERVGGEGSVTFSKEVRIGVEHYSIV